jgi:hypothetical protein
MRLNTSERRVLNRGETIARQFVNPESGELYWVDVKKSWDTLYFSCGSGWHKTAREARKAAT